MAIELERFLADQLARLPETHPDKPFLAAQKALVAAYLVHNDPNIRVTPSPASESLPEALLVTETTEQTVTTAPVTLYRATVAEPVAPAVEGRGEQTERERLVLRGRMGKRVRYSTTPRGVRRAEFNLATAVDEETTAWHTVLAFRERAERLEAANPQKGQYLEIIGYRDVVERKDAHGNPKQIERIIAAHIRLR